MSAEPIDPTIPPLPLPDPDKPGGGADGHGEGNGAPTDDPTGDTTVQGHGEGNKVGVKPGK